MEFEYRPFDVEPYLQQKVQPIFLISKPKPATKYYTLTNPATGEYSITTRNSDAIRVPVFGVAAKATVESMQNMTHGSLLTAAGLEVAMKFMQHLPARTTVTRLQVFIANSCHKLPDGSFRTYFGFVAEADAS